MSLLLLACCSILRVLENFQSRGCCPGSKFDAEDMFKPRSRQPTTCRGIEKSLMEKHITMSPSFHLQASLAS